MRPFIILIAIMFAGLAAPATAQSNTTNVVGRPAGPLADQWCGRDAAGACRVPRINADSTLATTATPVSSTPTNASGTVAASGGTAAMSFTATTDGEFVNPSTATWWCSWGTPAVNGAGSYPVIPNGTYRPPNRVAGTWTCLSTAASQAYTFTRF